jgi:hypothetical protein
MVLSVCAVACGSPAATDDGTATPDAAAATSTPTAMAALASATVAPTSDDEMEVVTSVWIDAQRANVPVEAWIGDTLCATSKSGSSPDAYDSLVTLRI